MLHRCIRGAVLAAAVLAAPAVLRAQNVTGTAPFTDGSDGGFQVARSPALPAHLPTGTAGDAGFYAAGEFVMLTQTRAIGNQTIARRGFYDLTGEVTGGNGLLVGSGTEALNPRNFSRQTWTPGFNVEIGYRFDDGTRIFANYLQVYDAHYTQGASLVPPLYRTRLDLADTYISSPVFNFSSFFAGPSGKIPDLPDRVVYGIWNAAGQMDIKFTQRYQQAEFGARIPMFMSDYSRVYGIMGGRFGWFFERFYWRTVSFDQEGNATASDAARYTNDLSQRMYGPMIGCGHEVFIADQFSLSLDLTGAALLNVVKMRAKYILESEVTQSKWGRQTWRLTPNLNAAFNAWWYPVEGVQVRVGYQAMSYYNTVYMIDPVGFDFGNIDPGYRFKAFRLVHGFNIGIGFFF